MEALERKTEERFEGMELAISHMESHIVKCVDGVQQVIAGLK